MASDPSDFVLKAYKTEQDALNDANRLKVNGATDVHITNKEQAAGYNFFTHEKYYFRIESNAPVKEFYIDWDDGENSDPNDGANYTLIKMNPPAMVGITSHIFTRDKVHFPKLRVKDSNGFLSKFYMPDRHSSDWNGTHVQGIDVLTAKDVSDSNTFPVKNNHYRFSVDDSSSASARIPKFAPTPKPPISVLKSDKKRVFAGITNKYLAGTGGEFPGKTCRLIGSHSTMDTVRSSVTVRVTYHVLSADQGDLSNSGSGELLVADISLGAPTIDNVLKVVKMELINLLEDTENMTNAGSAAANKLYPGEKLLLVTNLDGSNELEDGTATQPSIIGEVSLGNPIVILDDPKHTVTLDATESFAKCPESTIDEYKIWDGDFLMNNGYDTAVSFMSRSATNTSDIFTDGSGLATLLAPNGLKETSYAFHPLMTFTDEYHRWLPMQKLAMAQVKQSTALAKSDTSGPNDTRATYQYSFLEHWTDESVSDNYGEDRAGIAEYNWPSDMTSSAFMAFKGDNDHDDWLDLDSPNRTTGTTTRTNGSPDIMQAIFSQRDAAGIDSDIDALFGQGIQSLDEVDDEAGYLMCCSDKKWSKQWFQTIAFSDFTTGGAYRAVPVTVNTAANAASPNNEWTGMSFAGIRVEIFYTASVDGTDSNVQWKPLKYINNTKHPYLNDSTWYSSGSIEWMEPSDWIACDPAQIPDRFWPGGDFENAADTFSYDSDASGNYFDVSNRWNATNKKYGLMWVIAGDGGNTSGHQKFGWGPLIMSTFRCSNKHSALIDVVDPMHVSLNTHAVAQSVSYVHKGKYQVIEDRMGMAEIRKIGASSGALTFGSVDLQDSDGTFTRDKFYEYQKRAVPVYFDVEHKSGNISRFFGVITDMSEDHPVGLQFGKFGITMRCSHMIYMDSTGAILSDGYVSLGGDMIDEFKYI
jgi:hypothetical protein